VGATHGPAMELGAHAPMVNTKRQGRQDSGRGGGGARDFSLHPPRATRTPPRAIFHPHSIQARGGARRFPPYPRAMARDLEGERARDFSPRIPSRDGHPRDFFTFPEYARPKAKGRTCPRRARTSKTIFEN
jgi:hypothetical protein